MIETPKLSAKPDNGIIDFLLVLAKRKRLIVGLPIAVALVSAAVSFVLPEVYTSTTKLLPPQQAQSGAGAILSQLAPLSAGLGAVGLKSPNELYVGMLTSRTIADRLIMKFGLVEVYGMPTLEKARAQLKSNSKIMAGKDNLISIEVEDESRERAANIANSYVAELLKLTKALTLTEASQRRVFFERELETAKDNLANAEVLFKNAIETRGVISVDADTAALMETVGRMRAQIAAKEIQLRSMEAFITKDNQDYKRAQEDLISLKSQVSRLQNGNGSELNDDKIESVPKGLANIKILRDIKYYQMLYELLAKQYEAARLDEARDSSVIQVLDIAVKADLRSRPKRALIVLASTFAAFLLSILLAFLLDKRDSIFSSTEFKYKWGEFRSLMRFTRKTSD
ncbi:Wzz/FepE/Etk N-terminal domain-containing protein [Massilia sp. S19_KUP03_FR1]|uniref:Wzz/FepE/Etk N-terminal domain-containing protein n=1 Tax=Massilia sp. S19_KUP03_FR1 TaxID=3025503 RepID=UPI002FCDDBAD